MLALAESGQRRILTAEDIVKELKREIENAPKQQVIPSFELPSFRRNIHLLRLFNTPILDLLHPDSGDWEEGSAEAEQTEAVKIFLGNSYRLLKLTPHEIQRRVRDRSSSRSGDIDMRDDHTFTLSLPTTVRNSLTGKQLYYTLYVKNAGQRRGVDVRQRLHSCNDDEINLRSPLSRRQVFHVL